MTEILLATTDVEIKACYPVMQQLRPAYSEVAFLTQTKKQIQKGYHLAYLKDGRHICSVAGYRYSECLAWVDWLMEQAKSQQCAQLHLDSGVQRLDAHRFYEAQGMVHNSHHYAVDIT